MSYPVMPRCLQTVRRSAACCLLIAGLLTPCNAADESPSRAEWMHEAGWGVFNHSLADLYAARQAVTDVGYEKLTRPMGHPHATMNTLAFFQKTLPPLGRDEWNTIVDQFDVDTLARQLDEVGAGWFMIAIGQLSGHYCAPNAEFDRIVGFDADTTLCSRRDLVADMARALKPYGIRLLVYSPAHPARRNQRINEAFGTYGQFQPPETQRKWERAISAWSRQWGDLVDGWWFDGGYHVAVREEAPNKESMVAAARAGNPDAVICLNPALGVLPGAANEDYTAGEMDFPLGVEPGGRWVGHRQWHMLSYLGEWWSWSAHPRFSDEQAVAMTRGIVDAGGAVTWDVPLTVRGTLTEPFMRQLSAIGRAVDQPNTTAKASSQLWKTREPVPAGNLATWKPARLLSLDGAYTLPASGDGAEARLAKYGNDGDPETVAQAGMQWPWTYEVDLVETEEIRRILLQFGPGYATHFDIVVSPDRQHWQVVHTEQDHDGQPVEVSLDPTPTRYIRIVGKKPDGPGKEGEQMMVAELQVYGSP